MNALKRFVTFGPTRSSVELSCHVQAVYSALLVVACFGSGLAPLAAAHVRISELSAADSPAPGALAWRRMDLSAACNVAASAAAGHGEGAVGSGAPAAVLLGQLYRESPLGAAAQWRAVVAAAPGVIGLVPGSVAAGPLQAGADQALQVAGSAAGAQPVGLGLHDTGDPDPGSAISPDLAAFASDAAAARTLLRRLLPLQKAAAAAAAAAAAEANQDEAVGAGAVAGAIVGPGSGSWRLRGEARAVAGGTIVDVAQELQRNACYQGRAPARVSCSFSLMQGSGSRSLTSHIYCLMFGRPSAQYPLRNLTMGDLTNQQGTSD